VVAAYELTLAAAAYPGPVYLRLTRNPVPNVYQNGRSFAIGRAVKLREGADVGFVANGVMVTRALRAADELARRGINASVLDMHTVRPLDREALLNLARETGCLVAAEDHNINGGLGSAVCEFAAEEHPVPVQRIGLRDVFGESGDPELLLDEYGMGVADLIAAAEAVIRRKGGMST